MRTIPPVTLTLLLAAVTAFAQDATAIATTNTPVYIAPDTTRTPLRTAAQGTVFTVVAEQGEWTKVQFKDPQWGVRVGYVQTSALRFSRPELAPMDLSTTPAAAARPPSPQAVPARPAAPRPWEVPEPARSFERAWIDVNLGVAIAAEQMFAIEYSDTFFRETRTFRASYANPTGASFDFGGGVMFTPAIGLGVSLSGTAHRGSPELYVSVPHPNFFNAAASDTSEADRQFERVEGGINIQLMGVATLGRRSRVRVFGGPTYFRVQQDLVSDIRYAQVFGIFTRVNEVAITDYEYVEKVEGSGWGFHVGTDVSVFFTRVVGVGGFARFSQGRVDVTQPTTLESVELKAGGWQMGGGLRLKF